MRFILYTCLTQLTNGNYNGMYQPIDMHSEYALKLHYNTDTFYIFWCRYCIIVTSMHRCNPVKLRYNTVIA